METKIFAFTGKGGVGKTSLSAAFIRLLSEAYPEKKILAVDADPAVGLRDERQHPGETLQNAPCDIFSMRAIHRLRPFPLSLLQNRFHHVDYDQNYYEPNKSHSQFLFDALDFLNSSVQRLK